MNRCIHWQNLVDGTQHWLVIQIIILLTSGFHDKINSYECISSFIQDLTKFWQIAQLLYPVNPVYTELVNWCPGQHSDTVSMAYDLVETDQTGVTSNWITELVLTKLLFHLKLMLKQITLEQ